MVNLVGLTDHTDTDAIERWDGRCGVGLDGIEGRVATAFSTGNEALETDDAGTPVRTRFERSDWAASSWFGGDLSTSVVGALAIISGPLFIFGCRAIAGRL